MAGTLEVSDELCWMPAGWVFDTVLERLASELHTPAPELAAQLLAARTEANGGYLDLRASDRGTLDLLLNAADTAYDRLKQESAEGFRTPAFYKGLLDQFQEFRDMLHVSQHRRVNPQS